MTLVADVKSRFATVLEFIHKHEDVLWYVHSGWALIFGSCMMWLGAHHAGLLRFAIFQIAFLWVASLVVPTLVRPDGPSTSKWPNRIRMVINYLSKDFYQALLFGALPFYFRSASWSWNMLFVVFLAVSALLSTFDVVYDRVISARRSLMAMFFAFNLFASVNLMLPILWQIGTVAAMRLSVVLAVVGFSTILLGHHRLRGTDVWRTIGAAALVLMVFAEFARPIIPPAPLRLLNPKIGTAMNTGARQITQEADRLEPGWSGRVYALTPIQAPNGLRDRVGHRWYENGKLVYASRFSNVTGGRAEGFRYWTAVTLKNVQQGKLLVEVWTEGGQMIGRCTVPVKVSE